MVAVYVLSDECGGVGGWMKGWWILCNNGHANGYGSTSFGLDNLWINAPL